MYRTFLIPSLLGLGLLLGSSSALLASSVSIDCEVIQEFSDVGSLLGVKRQPLFQKIMKTRCYLERAAHLVGHCRETYSNYQTSNLKRCYQEHNVLQKIQKASADLPMAELESLSFLSWDQAFSQAQLTLLKDRLNIRLADIKLAHGYLMKKKHRYFPDQKIFKEMREALDAYAESLDAFLELYEKRLHEIQLMMYRKKVAAKRIAPSSL